MDLLVLLPLTPGARAFSRPQLAFTFLLFFVRWPTVVTHNWKSVPRRYLQCEVCVVMYIHSCNGWKARLSPRTPRFDAPDTDFFRLRNEFIPRFQATRGGCLQIMQALKGRGGRAGREGGGYGNCSLPLPNDRVESARRVSCASRSLPQAIILSSGNFPIPMRSKSRLRRDIFFSPSLIYIN